VAKAKKATTLVIVFLGFIIVIFKSKKVGFSV